MKYEIKHTLDGERVSEKEFKRRSRAMKTEGVPNLSRSDHWRKHESFAMACHPSQVSEFNELAKKAGTGVVYRPDGMPVITGKGMKRKEEKHRSMYNKDDYS